jgi:hypothetical protein
MNGNHQKIRSRRSRLLCVAHGPATAQASANDFFSPVGYHAWHVRDVALDIPARAPKRNSLLVSHARAPAHASRGADDRAGCQKCDGDDNMMVITLLARVGWGLWRVADAKVAGVKARS